MGRRPRGVAQLVARTPDADIFDRAKFPVQIATRQGPSGLVDAPPVIVGTIHSVKGGQADVVYLFPDLSQAADSQYQSDGPGRDT